MTIAWVLQEVLGKGTGFAQDLVIILVVAGSCIPILFFLTYTERYFLSFKGNSHLKLRKKGAAEPVRDWASCSQPSGEGDIWRYPEGEMWACQGFYWPLLTGPYKRAQVVIYDWGLSTYLKARHFDPVRIQKIMDIVHTLWYTCFSFDFSESLLLSVFPLSAIISHFALTISISDRKTGNESKAPEQPLIWRGAGMCP